jgi:hypothetical protein
MENVKLILKFIILNVFWFLCVKFGPTGLEVHFFIASLILITLNFLTLNKSFNALKYFIFVVFFALFGAMQDGLMLWLGIIELDSVRSLLWLISLWVVFLGYFGDLLNRFKDFEVWKLSLLGAGGGMMAYYGGANIGGISVSSFPAYLTIVAVSWAIFFPLSIRLFYSHYKT